MPGGRVAMETQRERQPCGTSSVGALRFASPAVTRVSCQNSLLSNSSRAVLPRGHQPRGLVGAPYS